MQSKSSLLSELELRFSESSKLLADLLEKSSEVIVFGSFAAGLSLPKSDIDILCVGYPRRIKTQKVDLVRIPESYLSSERWLTSELANHIAAYGVWLKGGGYWKSEVRISRNTIIVKTEQVLVRLAKLSAEMRMDEACTRRRYLLSEKTKLRRDLQRLHGLKMGRPTPATAVLDAEWNASGNSQLTSSLRRGLEDARGLIYEGVFEFGKFLEPVDKS